METWIDLLWFTIINLFLFGFLAKVLGGSDPQISQMLIVGFLLWEVVRIGQYCITVSVMWEVWSKSLHTLFVSPLNMKELMAGFMLSGFLKTLGVVVLMSVLAVIGFNLPLEIIGWAFIPYFIILLFFSFAAGVFITGLILRYSTDIQSLAWGLIYLLQPISAVFYPTSVLPESIRWVAYLSPITYVMESARGQMAGQSLNWSHLGIGFALTVGYFLLSAWFTSRMFYWSRKTGAFARLGH